MKELTVGTAYYSSRLCAKCWRPVPARVSILAKSQQLHLESAGGPSV